MVTHPSAMILYGFETHQRIDRGETGVFRKELIHTETRVPLSIVRKRLASKGQERLPAVLLVHGFGQNRYAWHLPSRSFSNYLAMRGFDVFNLDLRGHGRSRLLSRARAERIRDYSAEDIPAAIEEIDRCTGNAPLYLVGHSLGGLIGYSCAPSLSRRLDGLVTIGSPFHFTKGSRTLGSIAMMLKAQQKLGFEWADVPLAIGAVGSVLRSVRVIADSKWYPIPLRGFSVGSLEPLVLDEHFRLAFDWAGLGVLVEMFSRPAFGKGSETVDRFEDLNIPLLVIAGTKDDLAGPKAVRPAFDRSRSTDKTYREFDLGHIDILVGREAPLTVWPAVGDWIAARAKV